MSVRRVAMLSVHTSPLAQPGSGDGGGMNVYVRALGEALAEAGVACDVLTRAEHPEQPPFVDVAPGFRVVHLRAGPPAPVPKRELPALAEALTDAARAYLVAAGACDVLHANYWLSGAVAHELKHDLDLPLVATFHTLDRVKALAGLGDDPEVRARTEADVVRCADLMAVATEGERRQLADLYDADLERVAIVPPGVDHHVFMPGDGEEARRELGLGGRRVLLFVGRLQPLKGADLAIRTLGELDDPAAVLLVVGGPSGHDGERERARLERLVAALDVEDQVRFVPPQPHAELARYYRAAHVCVVPSHTESFGLVALEAAACGTPVVAAAVGGLVSIVEHGVTGFLVEGREQADYARPVAKLFARPDHARAIGQRAYQRAASYRWSITAARLRRLYGDLASRALVECN
jgi:D-inositol-3-phosphate glycosyltransferase